MYKYTYGGQENEFTLQDSRKKKFASSVATFRGCSSLYDIDILSIATTVGNDGFKECSSLTSIDNLSSVTPVSEYDFKGCLLLHNRTIKLSQINIFYSGETEIIYCRT